MKPIKKILNDALGNSAETRKKELSPEIMDFIKGEVERQLQELVDEKIIPEIRKVISESLQSGIRLEGSFTADQLGPSEAGSPGSHEDSPIIQEEILPLVEETSKADQTHTSTETRTTLSVKDIRLGIDFGTTTTAVSLRVGEEPPQALPIGRNGDKFMPSVIYFRPGTGDVSDRALFGEDAEAINDELRVIRSIKRCFGCEGGNCSQQHEENNEKFPWCNGDGMIKVGETETLPPSQIALYIIQEALNRAIKIINESNQTDLKLSDLNLAQLNLGCGANFNLPQRKLILKIAKTLGFTELKINNIVEEPILAGFAFSRFIESSEGRSVIYDFGGGTLDIAVVDVSRKDNKPFVRVLSTAGENWLGGDDIDILVYQEFIHQIGTDLGVASAEVEKYLEVIDRMNLRKRSREAKERLSNLDRYENSIFLEQLGMVGLTLTRERFETILDESQLVERSMDAMLRALKLAYALDVAKDSDLLDIKRVISLHLEDTAQSVNKVILVGGVTKIPFIQRKIKRIFGSENVVEENVFDPISAVAIGAAYPKEVEHFSISSPPFGFYLEGKQQGQQKRLFLLEPYTYLKFYKMIHANSIPTHDIPFVVDDEYEFVVLKGKEALAEEVKEIKNLRKMEPGNYHFYIGLDGSLTLLDKDGKPMKLGFHPFTHPLQVRIREERERRIADANKFPDKTLADDYIGLLNEN